MKLLKRYVESCKSCLLHKETTDMGAMIDYCEDTGEYLEKDILEKGLIDPKCKLPDADQVKVQVLDSKCACCRSKLVERKCTNRTCEIYNEVQNFYMEGGR